MPKYRVTGPNGRTVVLNGPTPPSEAELDQLFSTELNSPVDTPSPESEPDGLFGRTMDIMSRVGQTIGRLGSATAAGVQEVVEGTPGEIPGAIKDTFTPTGIGTWKRNTDFDDVLASGGMKEGWGRAALGFAGDLVIDPLNLVTGVPKVVTKAAGLLGDTAVAAAKKVPGAEKLAKVGDNIADTFVANRGLEKVKNPVSGMSFRDEVRLHDSTLRSTGEIAEITTEKMFKDVKDPQKLIDMLHEIDQTGASKTLPAKGSAWNQLMDEEFNKKVQWGMVDPKSRIDKYVPYMTQAQTQRHVSIPGSALKGTTRTDLPRTQYKSLADAVTHGGASEDAPVLLAKYLSSNGRAVANNEFVVKVATDYGSRTASSGMRKVNLSGAPDLVKQYVDDFYLPDEVAGHLEKAAKLWEEPTELDGLYKTAVKLWKGAATSINPGHHFVNMMGNFHNLYVGSDMTLPQIAKGWAKYAKMSYPPAVGKYSADEVFNAMKKYEIVGTANQLGEITDKSTRYKVVNNPVMRVARRKGQEWVEDPSKVTLFMHELKKGKSLEEAAIKVKNVMFDYAEITDAERKVRDYGLIPFYTWMRKNIPLQMEAIVKNPKKVERVSNLTNVPWNANQTEMNQTVIPEDRQMAGYMPGYLKSPDDVPIMQRVAMPNADINRLQDPAAFLRDTVGPLPKTAWEWMSGVRSNGAPVHTRTGFARPAGAAQLAGAILNPLLPEEMEGYVTPRNVYGRDMQNDTMAWLMQNIPTGIWGSTVAGSDPLQPSMPPVSEFGARFFGLTPDAITPTDQEFEAQRRMQAMRREMMRQTLEP